VKAVVDSNILVAATVPGPYSAAAARQLELWIQEDTVLFAPALWVYEAVSALRKFVVYKDLSKERERTLLSALLAIRVEGVPATEGLHQGALEWARRLDHFVAYDSAFLALAEYLEAPFWSADRKLVRRLRGMGVDWVYDVTEAS